MPKMDNRFFNQDRPEDDKREVHAENEDDIEPNQSKEVEGEDGDNIERMFEHLRRYQEKGQREDVLVEAEEYLSNLDRGVLSDWDRLMYESKNSHCEIERRFLETMRLADGLQAEDRVEEYFSKIKKLVDGYGNTAVYTLKDLRSKRRQQKEIISGLDVLWEEVKKLPQREVGLTDEGNRVREISNEVFKESDKNYRANNLLHGTVLAQRYKKYDSTSLSARERGYFSQLLREEIELGDSNIAEFERMVHIIDELPEEKKDVLFTKLVDMVNESNSIRPASTIEGFQLSINHRKHIKRRLKNLSEEITEQNS